MLLEAPFLLCGGRAGGWREGGWGRGYSPRRCLSFSFFFLSFFFGLIVTVGFYLKKGSNIERAGAARCDRNGSPRII